MDEKVTFVNILKELIPGVRPPGIGESYTVALDKDEQLLDPSFRKLVGKLREKIPVFKNRNDSEVAGMVVSAVEWATRHICRRLNYTETTKPGQVHSDIGLYQCNHPETGEFFLVVEKLIGDEPPTSIYSIVVNDRLTYALEDYRIAYESLNEQLWEELEKKTHHK